MNFYEFVLAIHYSKKLQVITLFVFIITILFIISAVCKLYKEVFFPLFTRLNELEEIEIGNTKIKLPRKEKYKLQEKLQEVLKVSSRFLGKDMCLTCDYKHACNKLNDDLDIMNLTRSSIEHIDHINEIDSSIRDKLTKIYEQIYDEKSELYTNIKSKSTEDRKAITTNA